MAEAVASLVGALLGGTLVLIGDGVRRRAERKQNARRQLFDAAVALAVAYNSLSGALIDAHDRGLARAEAPLPGAERYAVQTRFWASPGSAALSREASALSQTWEALLSSYDTADKWRQQELPTRRRSGHSKVQFDE
jgi:hypothetical protein